MAVKSKPNSKGQLIWYARGMVNGRKYFKSFGVGRDARNDARAYDAEKQAETGKGSHRQDPGNFTFRDIAEKALPGLIKNVKGPMSNTYKYRIQRIADRVGHRKMDSISSSEIENLQVWLRDEKKLSPKSVNDYVSLFVRVFDFAVKEKLFASNPMKPYKQLKEGNPNGKRKPLSKNEWKILSEFLRDDWFSDAITALLHTGCRLSEIRMLDWEDIHENHIEIKEDEDFAPKSESGNRLVPLGAAVKKILERNRQRKTTVPFPGADETKRFPKTSLQNRWRLVLRQLQKSKGVELKCRIHDLRHTFGFWTARTGIPITALMKIMGHSNVQQTLLYCQSDHRSALEDFWKNSPFSE